MILLYTILLFVSACNSDDNVLPAQANISADPITYLALGDSYTIGEAVGEDERFPVQLADSLQSRGIKVEQLDIVARTGWTTQELDAGIDARDDLLEAYDLVTLLIGVNNQYRGRSVEEYQSEFPKMLNRAIDFAGGDKSKVIVVSIPDYAYTPFGNGRSDITEGIDAYNAINQTITEQEGITYVNITDISRKGLAEPELVAQDGLHPSGLQYSLWVQRIVQGVEVE